MKKLYEAPIIEIEMFETEDILAISIVDDEKGILTEVQWDQLN